MPTIRRFLALLAVAGLSALGPAPAALAESRPASAPHTVPAPEALRTPVTTGLQATARASAWVKRDVPYSQSATFDGYRTDCSGYVSMAWGLARPGLTTYSLRRVGDFISKPQLRRGDLLLDPLRHAVLFDKWANAERTSYWGYEESSSQGAVYREIPYPYWSGYGHFRPFHKRGLSPA